MKGFGSVVAIVLLSSLSICAVSAGPSEDADVAYRCGNYTIARELYGPLADQGNPLAQARLGVLYASGKGVARDYAEAMKWFGRAAAQGFAKGQAGLGLGFESGQGVVQNYSEAAKWYRMAAEQGFAPAQFSL